MESVLSRYKNLMFLVGVLFLQVLGLAMQVKRASNEAQDTRLIRIWAVGAVTPFERALVWSKNSTGGIWHNYFYLRGVRAENRQLKEQIEQMRLQQVRLTEDAAQARRLQSLLGFKEQFISKTVAAQVIGSSGSDMSRIVYIDKGEKAGIARDMAVITAEGIVGKVLLVYQNVSQVLLISDQSSGVGAILEKTRLQGVLRGTANGEVVLERVMSDEDVPVGETVLTSGGDQIFPKGLPVGTVAKVDKGKELFLSIKIRPAASLSRLEEVLVLVEKQERTSTAQENVRVRAADILAQRLPSVPDKPADATAATAASVGVTKPNASASTAANAAGSATDPAKKGSGTAVPAGTKPSSTQPVSTQSSSTQAPASKPKAPAPPETSLKPDSIVEQAPKTAPKAQPPSKPASDQAPAGESSPN
jgi:rod shape-determining protein MreC